MDVLLGLGITFAVVVGIPSVLALLLLSGQRCTCRHTHYGRVHCSTCKVHNNERINRERHDDYSDWFQGRSGR